MKVHIKGLSVLKSYLANKIKEGCCMNSSVEEPTECKGYKAKPLKLTKYLFKNVQ